MISINEDLNALFQKVYDILGQENFASVGLEEGSFFGVICQKVYDLSSMMNDLAWHISCATVRAINENKQLFIFSLKDYHNNIEGVSYYLIVDTEENLTKKLNSCLLLNGFV